MARVLLSAGPVEPFNIIYFATRVQTLLTPVFLVYLHRRLRAPSNHELLAVDCRVDFDSRSQQTGYLRCAEVGHHRHSLIVCCGMGGRHRVVVTASSAAAVNSACGCAWVVGVRIATAGVLWGPGFELRRLESVPTPSARPALIVGAGAAVPTPEGPRPLMGHGWVFGGEWKRFVNAYWTENWKPCRRLCEVDSRPRAGRRWLGIRRLRVFGPGDQRPAIQARRW